MPHFLRKILNFFKRKHTAEILEKWLDKAYKWHRTKYLSKYELYTKTQDIKMLSIIDIGKNPSPEEIKRAEEIYQSWNKYSLSQKIAVENIAQKGVPLGSKCLICGAIDNLMRHHQDYSKPLEIVTLCSHHHTSVHSKNKRGHYLRVPTTFSTRLIIDIERKLAEQQKPKPLNR